MRKNRIGARAKKKQLQWQLVCNSVDRFNNALIDASNNKNVEAFDAIPSIFIAEEHFHDLMKLGKTRLS